MPTRSSATAQRLKAKRSSPRASMRNPKRGAAERQGMHTWVPYYAGFAESFVRDAIRDCVLDRTSVVLDPMNGSGTTTVAAQHSGCLSLGFDLNPVMAIVANAKDASLRGNKDIEPAAREIAARVARSSLGRKAPDLGPWLSPKVSSQLHLLLHLVRDMPDNAAHNSRLLSLLNDQGNVLQPGSKAFLLAAVLITARSAATTQSSKNPTWLKPNSRRPRMSHDIPALFLSNVSRMLTDLEQAFSSAQERRRFLVGSADARKLPIRDASIDAIITSPPYLTRIDYAMSTAPELALLGFATAADFRKVRASLMGSTCITHGPYESRSSWGKQCTLLIDAVRAHRSKSSASYYAKTFVQYFRDAEEILQQYFRVLKPGQCAAVVVQDSWYKDLHVPLGHIYVEMSSGVGFRDASIAQSAKVRSHLGLVNTRARAYSKGDISEHILMLRK